MEALLFDDWRDLAPGEQDTSLLFTSAPLLVGGGMCEDRTAASDLRFLDALLPHLADAGGDHGGWADACDEACSGDDAGAPHASAHVHDSVRPAGVQDNDAQEDVPAHACLDSHHPPGCTRCTPPPCADDAALYFLRGSKGACAPRMRVHGTTDGYAPRRPAAAAVRAAPLRATAPRRASQHAHGARGGALPAGAAWLVPRTYDRVVFPPHTSVSAVPRFPHLRRRRMPRMGHMCR
jgi:hypothetical protein